MLIPLFLSIDVAKHVIDQKPKLIKRSIQGTIML